MPPGGWPDEKIQQFEDWVQDGASKMRGERYASFFAMLDYRTEYFDVSGLDDSYNLMPAVFRYFPGPALRSWWLYAEIPEELSDEKQEARKDVEAEIVGTEAGAAIMKVDAVLRDLALEHFEVDGFFAATALIDGFMEFGRDRLPANRDRLERIKARNDPSDFRLQYAEFHRMDGASMWFNWAGHLGMAEWLGKSEDGGSQVRHAMLSAVCAGSAMDFVFRHRARTKPHYYGDSERAIWRQAHRSLRDFAAATKEAHELVQLYQAPGEASPALVAAYRGLLAARA